MTTLRLILPFLLLATALPCTAQRATDDDWTIDEILHQETMRSVSFSPDGDMIVWSQRRVGKDNAKDRFVTDLYLTRLQARPDGSFRTTQLTRGNDTDHSARFSRDGEWVYFLSSREKSKKLWRLSVYGGEPEAVHTFKNGISNPQWQGDSTLLFVSHDGKSLREQEAEKKKDDVIVVEDTSSWRITHLYAFDLGKKKTTRLTSERRPVQGYTVSRDGRHVVYWLTGSPHQAADAQPKSPYFLHDTRSGQTRQILQGLQSPYALQFTADGKGLYFLATRSSNPEWDGAGIGEVYYLDVATATPRKVDLDWELGAAGGLQVVGQDFIVALANRATRRFVRYRKRGNDWTREQLGLGDRRDNTNVLAVAENGERAIVSHSTAQVLPTFHVADLGDKGLSDLREVVKLNGKLKKKTTARTEVVEWKGWNDEPVTGILYYPTDYEEGRAYPLMLSIHGGPASATLDAWYQGWSSYPQLLSQRGSFVLKPNYHGSNNHGLAFVESIKGNYYEPEMEDLSRGIDWLVERGMVDPDSLGTMGWSNGAIITTMLTVRYPERFRVACPGAGDVNWTSDYGTCRFGVSFDQSYFGGAPWDDTGDKPYNENYLLKSPLFELEKVRTPTIIFHGSEDRAVPRDQGWEYYRALQQIDRAPVRFLWFPGQPHGLQKLTHQKRKMEEELRWIDTYLFGKDDRPNPTLKKDSPLAHLLRTDSLPRVNGHYGVAGKDGRLLPELVALGKDSLLIGRFEVTNAQYAAFDGEHAYPAAEGNFPARVSRAAAGRYLTWLSDVLGHTVRLPTADEATRLHAKARAVAAKENTLNYWAGYAITPAEVPDFRRQVEALERPLYRPVGSFPAVTVAGGARLYDLGGNVAEYAAGNGHYGYGAYDYVDPTAKGRAHHRDSYGFRVVRDR